ncbi:hypothetical protein C7M41_00590 [Pediococcus acidilactici]|uniref:restriction endonuclease subunit S n=1 Tax=Pediococcus acidilactici TaxID=1254 RepID=UPI0013635E69|nr:restriction endonuclease subunit S [Pediococcus acidilactici]QHM51888.1 hypothetical protein C7M41_00590 [Pediococcus acidilactici]
MSEEKNVPNIRFKGFTDPWEQRKLGECLNVNSGKDYKSLKRGNIPVYGTGGYMCSVDQALSYNEDAIGIGRKGTINKPYILKAPFWTVDTLFYIVPKAKLNLFFMYLIFQKVNWKRKDESTGVPSLSKSIIKSVKELFPKGREQNEIAELFEILDTTIALHQQKVTQLKELKKLLMQKIFDQEWRFRGFTDPWEQRKLGDVSSKVTEKNKSKKYTETLTNSAEYGIINQYAFFDKSISNSNSIASYYVVKRDNFVYNPRISTAAPVGPINRNRLNIIGIMSPLYYVFEATNIDKSYLEYYFKTTKWHNFMKIEGNTGARSDRLAIKDKVLVKMPIPYPKVKEQKQIGELFESIDTTIALHQQKVDQLKELKKYLMQNLFV